MALDSHTQTPQWDVVHPLHPWYSLYTHVLYGTSYSSNGHCNRHTVKPQLNKIVLVREKSSKNLCLKYLRQWCAGKCFTASSPGVN